MKTVRKFSGSMAMHTLLLGAALAVAGDAAAEQGPDTFDRSGWYLGVSGVYAIENFDRAFGDSAGLGFRLGYRAWPRLAAELRYEWLEGFDSNGPIPEFMDPPLDLNHGGVELDTHQATLGAKLFALTGRVQPYGLLGVGMLIVNTELKAPKFEKPFRIDVGFAARFGAGVDLYATEHVVIGIEGSYLVPTGSVSGEQYGTVELGLLYRF